MASSAKKKSSPCVSPGVALRKDGKLKPGFVDKKVKRGKRCIRRAKVAGRKATGASRPCPRGSYRAKAGKNRGKCRKLTGAAAASRRRKSSTGVARVYHSGAQAYAAARGCPKGSFRDKRSGKCRKLTGAAAAAAAGKKVGFMRKRGSSNRPDFMAF